MPGARTQRELAGKDSDLMMNPRSLAARLQTRSTEILHEMNRRAEGKLARICCGTTSLLQGFFALLSYTQLLTTERKPRAIVQCGSLACHVQLEQGYAYECAADKV